MKLLIFASFLHTSYTFLLETHLWYLILVIRISSKYLNIFLSSQEIGFFSFFFFLVHTYFTSRHYNNLYCYWQISTKQYSFLFDALCFIFYSFTTFNLYFWSYQSKIIDECIWLRYKTKGICWVSFGPNEIQSTPIIFLFLLVSFLFLGRRHRRQRLSVVVMENIVDICCISH